MAPATIRAGELRNVIQIVQPTLAQDSTGGWKIDQDNLVAEVYAKIEPYKRGEREVYAAEQRVSQLTHIVTIRYMPGIKAGMNVWFTTREFQILAIENPDNQKQHFLELLCLERDDSAREAGGGATNPATVPIQTPVIFTADGSTNVFTLPYSPPRGILLFWDGLLQASGVDYALTGPRITLARQPEDGDVLAVLVL